MCEGGHRYLPALADVVEAIGIVDFQVLEQFFVESCLAGNLDQRPHRDRLAELGFDRHNKVSQAIVFIRLVGACQQDHPGGKLRGRGPHLVSVDYPSIAFALGESLYAGQIGTSTGLTESLAPQLFSGKQFGQQASLEVFRPVEINGGRGHAESYSAGHDRCLGA